MHIKAAPLEKVNERFVLVAVTFVARARREQDEVTMQTLRYEWLFAGADDGFFFDLIAGGVQQFLIVTSNHARCIGEPLAPHIIE